jgi:transcriptional regulator with XRE-family HTH domain
MGTSAMSGRAVIGALRERGLSQRDAARVARMDQATLSQLLGGDIALSPGRKREFLFSVGAKVLLYPDGERTPRAQLILALPTSAAVLPPAPWSTRTKVEGGWSLDLDLADGAALAGIRGITIKRREGGPTTFEDDLRWYEERLREQVLEAEVAKLHATAIVRSTFRRS